MTCNKLYSTRIRPGLKAVKQCQHAVTPSQHVWETDGKGIMAIRTKKNGITAPSSRYAIQIFKRGIYRFSQRINLAARIWPSHSLGLVQWVHVFALALAWCILQVHWCVCPKMTEMAQCLNTMSSIPMAINWVPARHLIPDWWHN